MVVADETHSLQITGTGDVLEPHDGIIGAFSGTSSCVATQLPRHTDARIAPPMSRAAIGSGGSYALAAARALIDIPGMDALTIGALALLLRACHCSALAAARAALMRVRACSQARHDDCGGHVHLHQPQLHD